MFSAGKSWDYFNLKSLIFQILEKLGISLRAQEIEKLRIYGGLKFIEKQTKNLTYQKKAPFSDC